MKMDKLKLSAVIIAIGLVAAVISCLLTGIVKVPTVTAHDFSYSVTYRLNDETKTFSGVYQCSFDGVGDGIDRFYTGEYTEYGLATHTYAYTIAQQDGFDLCVVTAFNDCYLMGDIDNEYYSASLADPYLTVYDEEGVAYEDEEPLGMFDVEIISWEYPEPIENSFVFAGFSRLHETSMLAMSLVGFVTLVVCLIFVKKDKDVTYGVLDKIGVVLNFLTGLVAFPFLTVVSCIVQAFKVGPEWIYQGDFCVPAIIMFSLAASISLRRKGFSKIGFFIQFTGPVVFFVLSIFEMVL